MLRGGYLFVPARAEIPSDRPMKYTVREDSISEIPNEADDEDDRYDYPHDLFLFSHGSFPTISFVSPVFGHDCDEVMLRGIRRMPDFIK